MGNDRADSAGPRRVEAAQTAPLILVAEDNEDNRMIAVTILRHFGYRAIEATTGTDALRLARSEHPALILMDVGMPDVDGWMATRTLKSEENTASIIILAFTAHTMPSDRQCALEAGCDGFVAKPIEPVLLVREVERALGDRSLRAVTAL